VPLPPTPIVPVPSRSGDPTLLDLFDAVVSGFGEREAMVECTSVDDHGTPATRRITFATWAAAADAWAADMVDSGVQPGDVVAITLPSGIDYAVAHHAALRAGAIATGINPRLGPGERRHILDACMPALVIDEAPGDLVSMAAAGDPLRRHVDRHATDPVAIVWTGGTTGLPKGVVFDHLCLATMALGAAPLSTMGDRRLSPLPFSHVGTMTRTWDEWSHLITTVVTPTPWTPVATAGLLVDEHITVCQGVPTQYALLCDHLEHHGISPDDLTGLRIAGIGGSRIPPELVRRIERVLGCPVVARYASTESVIATGTQPGDDIDVVCTTVGRPNGPVEMRIIDDHGNELSPGPDHVGTVALRSRAVMRSYLGDPERTAGAVDPDGWLRTGDLGWVGDDGNLRLVGRTTEMYIRGGYNVYPAEVENCLGTHAHIGAAAVVGATAPHSALGEIGVAFVVPTPGSPPPDTDTVRQHVATELASYKTPDIVVVTDELPLTTIGKIDKRALQARADQEASTWHRPTQGNRQPKTGPEVQAP
jgi:acyl-CoA synthetase (AMP-forming)/AMP-acid ligase II